MNYVSTNGSELIRFKPHFQQSRSDVFSLVFIARAIFYVRMERKPLTGSVPHIYGLFSSSGDGFGDVVLLFQGSAITAWAAHQWRCVEIWLVLRFSRSPPMETAAWLCLQTGSCLDGETLNTCSWHLLPRQHRWDELAWRRRGLWRLI